MYVYIICTYIIVYIYAKGFDLSPHPLTRKNSRLTCWWVRKMWRSAGGEKVPRTLPIFLTLKSNTWLKLNNKHQSKVYPNWLVVYLPLWKIWKSVGMIVPNIWKSKKCSKPPTRLDFHNFPYLLVQTCSSNSSDLAVVPCRIYSARLLSLHRFLIGFWVEFS